MSEKENDEIDNVSLTKLSASKSKVVIQETKNSENCPVGNPEIEETHNHIFPTKPSPSFLPFYTSKNNCKNSGKEGGKQRKLKDFPEFIDLDSS
jgi:hypothetical protein